MTTPTMPEGFKPLDTETEKTQDPQLATPGRDWWARGYVCIYRGRRQLQTRHGKKGLHKLESQRLPGTYVGLWGSVDLDKKLRHAKDGDVVFIRFAGERPRDDGNTELVWDVGISERAVSAPLPSDF